MGGDLADLNRIVPTHAHPHEQGAPALREHTGARVLIHTADAAWPADGRGPADGRSSPAARRFDQLPAAHWTPFKPDATVEDGELNSGSGGLRVNHTPGHSPGHIALLHEPTRTVLAGDAVFHAHRLGDGPATFAAEPAARSIDESFRTQLTGKNQFPVVRCEQTQRHGAIGACGGLDPARNAGEAGLELGQL